MRLLALTTLSVMVAIMSGLALFWTISTQRNELWLDAMFIVAALLSLIFLLAMINKAANRSIGESVTYQGIEDSRLGGDRRPKS